MAPSTVAQVLADGGGHAGGPHRGLAGFEGWPFAAVASVVAFVARRVGGLRGVRPYLAVAIGRPGLRAHANEAFAAARITRYKDFLRLHVDRDGRSPSTRWASRGGQAPAWARAGRRRPGGLVDRARPGRRPAPT